MLEVVNTLEIELVGVFRDFISARSFNKNLGSKIKLYPVRTTLPITQFTKEIFHPGNDGAFLENCVGKGNVQIRIIKNTFPAVRGHVGNYSDRRELLNRPFIKERVGFHGIYKTSELLGREEIQKLAINPFKFLRIHQYGVVDSRNIEEFLRYFDESSKHLLEEEAANYVVN